jgi:hypothetical protein
MRQSVNVIKKLLDECSERDRSTWHSQTQAILSAVHASHPTRRGVQTAIAAAFFENAVLPRVAGKGWQRRSGMPRREPPCVVIEKDERKVLILIATLELSGGKSRRKFSQDGRDDRYVVRLRKKLARLRPNSKLDSEGEGESGLHKPSRTRAWSFDEFDILAVNTQPATRQWTDFRFALSRELLPSRDHPTLIAGSQPVSLGRSTKWMVELGACLDRFLQS